MDIYGGTNIDLPLDLEIPTNEADSRRELSSNMFVYSNSYTKTKVLLSNSNIGIAKDDTDVFFPRNDEPPFQC